MDNKRLGLTVSARKKSLCLAAFAVLMMHAACATETNVHAVLDIAHEFTFYTESVFPSQYLRGHRAARSWGALYKIDISNANLLILPGCVRKLCYVPKDIGTIKSFLREGGGVVIFGGSNTGPQNDLLRVFGASFVKGSRMPLLPHAALGVTNVEGGSLSHLAFDDPNKWVPLVIDSEKKSVVAMRTWERGRLLVCPSSLAENQRTTNRPRNVLWLTPVLQLMAGGKTVDRKKTFAGGWLTPGDNVDNIGNLKIHYSDYLMPYAKSMADIYQRVKPNIEDRMGVSLSKGMTSEIGLLATGDGGFSSGRVLGLATWWGGFPEKEDGMIEFITHEAVHSWTLPFAEIWGEPIATYIGLLVMGDMGYQERGQKRIDSAITEARRLDPEMRLYDLSGTSNAGAKQLSGDLVRILHWGKTYWILEELRKEKPDSVARYFRAKRRLALPTQLKTYGVNETVAVLSVAMERDMFPWFREHGFDVDRSRSAITD